MNIKLFRMAISLGQIKEYIKLKNYFIVALREGRNDKCNYSVTFSLYPTAISKAAVNLISK